MEREVGKTLNKKPIIPFFFIIILLLFKNIYKKKINKMIAFFSRCSVELILWVAIA